MIRINTPFTKEIADTLRAGDRVLISGTIYTARDAAHKRMIELLEKNEPLPIDIRDAIIYYAGPCPAQPGKVIGSCGPTTSGRMDAYAPRLLTLGLRGMIGKGQRNEAVKDAIKKTHSVYFGATGGAGALISKCVKECTPVAFEDLGAEAIYKLTVEDFPCVVIIDTLGDNLIDTGTNKYRR